MASPFLPHNSICLSNLNNQQHVDPLEQSTSTTNSASNFSSGSFYPPYHHHQRHHRLSKTSSTSRSSDAAIDFLKLLVAEHAQNCVIGSSSSSGNNVNAVGAGMSLNQVAAMLSVPPMVVTSALSSQKSSRLLRRQLRKWIMQVTNQFHTNSSNVNGNNSNSRISGRSDANSAAASDNVTRPTTATGVGAWDFSKFPRQLAMRVVAESHEFDAMESSLLNGQVDDAEQQDDLDSVSTSVLSLLDDDVRQHFQTLSRSMGQNFVSILNAPPADAQKVEAAARAAGATANSWANWIVGGITGGVGGGAGGRDDGGHNSGNANDKNYTSSSSIFSSASSAVSYGLDSAAMAQLPAYIANPSSTHLITSSTAASATSSSSEQLLKHASRTAAQIASKLAAGVGTAIITTTSTTTTGPLSHAPTTQLRNPQQQQAAASGVGCFSQDLSTIEQYVKDLQLSWKLRRDILMPSTTTTTDMSASPLSPGGTTSLSTRENQMLNVIDQVEAALADGRPLIPPTMPKMFYDYGHNGGKQRGDGDVSGKSDDTKAERNSAPTSSFNMRAIIEAAFPGPVVLDFAPLQDGTDETYQNKTTSDNVKSNSKKGAQPRSIIVVDKENAAHITRIEEDDCAAATDTVAALEGCLDTARAWLMCYVHRQSQGFYEASITFDDLSREARAALTVGDSAFEDVSAAGSSLTGSMVQLARLQRRRQNLSSTLELLQRMEKFQRKSTAVLSSPSPNSTAATTNSSSNSSSCSANSDPVLKAFKRLTQIQTYLVAHPELNATRQQTSNSAGVNKANTTSFPPPPPSTPPPSAAASAVVCFIPIIKNLSSKRSLLRQQLPLRASSYWSLQRSASSSSSTTDPSYWHLSNHFLQAAIELGCLSGCLSAYRERTVLDFATKVLQCLLQVVLDHSIPDNNGNNGASRASSSSHSTGDYSCVRAYEEFLKAHQQRTSANAAPATSKSNISNNSGTRNGAAQQNQQSQHARLSGPAYRTAMARIVQLSTFMRNTHQHQHKNFLLIASEVFEQVFSHLAKSIDHATTLYSNFLANLRTFPGALRQPQHQPLLLQIKNHAHDLYKEHLCNLRDVCLLSVAAMAESYPLNYTGGSGGGGSANPNNIPTSVDFNVIHTMNALLDRCGNRLLEAFAAGRTRQRRLELTGNRDDEGRDDYDGDDADADADADAADVGGDDEPMTARRGTNSSNPVLAMILNNKKENDEQQKRSNVCRSVIEVDEQASQLKSLGLTLVKTAFKNYHNKMFEQLLTVMQQDDWTAVEKVPRPIQKLFDCIFQDPSSSSSSSSASAATSRKELETAGSTTSSSPTPTSFASLVERFDYDLCEEGNESEKLVEKGHPQGTTDDGAAGSLNLGIKIKFGRREGVDTSTYQVTQSVLTLAKILKEYKRYEDAFGDVNRASAIIPEMVASRVGIMLKAFDGQCTALVLGGGAAECGTVQAISWSHLATASVDLKVLARIAEQWEKRVEYFFGSLTPATSSDSSTNKNVILADLRRVKSDLLSHRMHLLGKIISTLAEKIEAGVFKNAPAAALVMSPATGQQAESNWLIALLKEIARLRKVTRSVFAADSNSGENEDETRVMIQALYTIAVFVRKHFVVLASSASSASTTTTTTITNTTNVKNPQSAASSVAAAVAVVQQAAQYVVPLLRANIRHFGYSAVAVLKLGNATLTYEGGAGDASSAFCFDRAIFSSETAADEESELKEMLLAGIQYGDTGVASVSSEASGRATPTPPTTLIPSASITPVATPTTAK